MIFLNYSKGRTYVPWEHNLNLTGGAVGPAIVAPMQNSIIGLLSLTTSAILLTIAKYQEEEDKLIKNPMYRRIAGMVYNSMVTQAAYGHHTTEIDDMERRVVEKLTSIKRKTVRDVIDHEIELGHINKHHGTSISITMERSKLEDIIKNYSDNIKENVKARIEDLKKGKIPAGVR